MTEKTRVSCIECGATNNYPAFAGDKKVVCGKCRKELPRPGMVLEGTPAQLDLLMQKSKLPLLVDFYSPACAPCQIMHPILEKLAGRRAGELTVLRMNTDQHSSFSGQLGIHAVPTFLVLANGNERGRMNGAMPEADFSFWVASLV